MFTWRIIGGRRRFICGIRALGRRGNGCRGSSGWEKLVTAENAKASRRARRDGLCSEASARGVWWPRWSWRVRQLAFRRQGREGFAQGAKGWLLFGGVGVGRLVATMELAS